MFCTEFDPKDVKEATGLQIRLTEPGRVLTESDSRNRRPILVCKWHPFWLTRAMVKHCITLVVCFAYFPVLSQTDLLEWNPYRLLAWHDFEGQPTKGSHGDAGTVVRIEAKPFQTQGGIRYTVRALFVRNKSWARDRSDQLLKHEQLHFDIAEWYARKIRQVVEQSQARGEDDITLINRQISTLLTESDRIDRQYDAETLHGSMPKKQQQWEKKVKRELEKLNGYARKKQVIRSK